MGGGRWEVEEGARRSEEGVRKKRRRKRKESGRCGESA